MGRVPAAGTLPGVNGLYAHFLHPGQYGLAFHLEPIIGAQSGRDPAVPKLRMLGISNINQPVQLHVPLRNGTAPVVQGRTVQRKHLSLYRNRKDGMVSVDHGDPFRTMDTRFQIFFSSTRTERSACQSVCRVPQSELHTPWIVCAF